MLDTQFGVRSLNKNGRWDGSWLPDDLYLNSPAAAFQIEDHNGVQYAVWKAPDGQPLKAQIRTEKARRSFRFNESGKQREVDIVTQDGRDHVVLTGSRLTLTGEYSRMQDTFRNLGVGLVLASLLIYFLMVGLDNSFIVPLAVMSSCRCA